MAPCFSNLNSEFANTKLLYATSARIGGSGLDSVAHESLRAAEAAGLDWRALAFDLRASDLPSHRVRNLRRHPVRLFSWVMGSEFYYGAKKQALDRAAAFCRIESSGCASVADEAEATEPGRASELTTRALRFSTTARELTSAARLWRVGSLD